MQWCCFMPGRNNPLQVVLNLLYPPKCMVCGRLLATPDLCPDCAALLEAALLPEAVRLEGGIVCAAAFYYDEPLRDVILRYKFHGRAHYSPTLGRYLARAAQMQLPGSFDLVTWAPVSRRRRRQRGYDQGELLARAVAEAWNIPAQPLLKKSRHTPRQSSLNARERRANAAGAYAPVNHQPLTGQRVLLVDDIVTTGSTLLTCAGVLQQQGAEVLCAALAAERLK